MPQSQGPSPGFHPRQEDVQSRSRPHGPRPPAVAAKSIPTSKQLWLGTFNDRQETFQIFVQKYSGIPKPSSSLSPTPPAAWCPRVPGSCPFGGRHPGGPVVFGARGANSIFPQEMGIRGQVWEQSGSGLRELGAQGPFLRTKMPEAPLVPSGVLGGARGLALERNPAPEVEGREPPRASAGQYRAGTRLGPGPRLVALYTS